LNNNKTQFQNNQLKPKVAGTKQAKPEKESTLFGFMIKRGQWRYTGDQGNEKCKSVLNKEMNNST
jgi:hypothetical protein